MLDFKNEFLSLEYVYYTCIIIKIQTNNLDTIMCSLKTNCMDQKSYFEMCPMYIVINVSISKKIINVYILTRIRYINIKHTCFSKTFQMSCRRVTNYTCTMHIVHAYVICCIRYKYTVYVYPCIFSVFIILC